MGSDPSETRASSSPSHPLDAGGFAPGHILADRYRIVALVGRGGMGEVYRADDLKLGQPVALKFLPAQLERDPAARDRLLAEVRNARTVAHPNVCRVYDVGEVGSRVFLTMEYIDGEDLASLLRRIGKLPAAKALEVARQLCAGLAAAHDKGVLHRDLKPANVMIDGRGQARITDFGLAVSAGAAAAAADVAGTLQYMAPERFHGAPATVQSDLYGLGLILYETYTGKQPFKASSVQEWERAHTDSTPSSPSALASEIEPAVDRAILRCLEKDPAKRPASAAQVAAALPGGDPLAAAIAAGETPSPELVAASGEEGTLPRWQAWAWLAACISGLVIAAVSLQWVSLTNLVPFDGGPEILQARARSILRSLGYDQAPRDSDWWTAVGAAQLRVLASRDSTERRFADAARIIPGPLLFTYRQSPRRLVPFGVPGIVRFNDPPPEVRGDALVRLDTLGRLTYLRVVPGTDASIQSGTAEPEWPAGAEPDWRPLLAATGLSEAGLTPDVPRGLPPVPFDARRAWTGRSDGDGFRIEAASFNGRVVFTQWGGVEDAAAGTGAGGENTGANPAQAAVLTIVMLLLAAVAMLARHNVRLGRGDRQGARRLAGAMLVTGLLSDLASRHWVLDTWWVYVNITTKLGNLLFWAGAVWLAYLAFEPLARRAWPHWLTGWTRLLDGRWRDPLVGQSLLSGILFGTLLATTYALPQIGGRLLSLQGASPRFSNVGIGPLYPAAQYLSTVVGFKDQVTLSLMAVAFMVIARLVLRIDRAVFAAAAVVMALYAYSPEQPLSLSLVRAGITGVFAVVFLRRYGLLALAAAYTVAAVVSVTPWTLDMTKWFAWRPMLTAALVLALAIWGFRNVLGRQSAFPTGALDG